MTSQAFPGDVPQWKIDAQERDRAEAKRIREIAQSLKDGDGFKSLYSVLSSGEVVSSTPVRVTDKRAYFSNECLLYGINGYGEKYLALAELTPRAFSGRGVFTTAEAALDAFLAPLRKSIAKTESTLADYRSALATAEAARATYGESSASDAE